MNRLKKLVASNILLLVVSGCSMKSDSLGSSDGSQNNLICDIIPSQPSVQPQSKSIAVDTRGIQTPKVCRAIVQNKDNCSSAANLSEDSKDSLSKAGPYLCEPCTGTSCKTAFDVVARKLYHFAVFYSSVPTSLLPRLALSVESFAATRSKISIDDFVTETYRVTREEPNGFSSFANIFRDASGYSQSYNKALKNAKSLVINPVQGGEVIEFAILQASDYLATKAGKPSVCQKECIPNDELVIDVAEVVRHIQSLPRYDEFMAIYNEKAQLLIDQYHQSQVDAQNALITGANNTNTAVGSDVCNALVGSKESCDKPLVVTTPAASANNNAAGAANAKEVLNTLCEESYKDISALTSTVGVNPSGSISLDALEIFISAYENPTNGNHFSYKDLFDNVAPAGVAVKDTSLCLNIIPLISPVR